MIDLTHLLIDIENQRQYNSCVGQSLSTYLEAIWRKFDPDHAQEFSPAFIWAMAKGESKVTQNKGVIPAFALAMLKKHGCCLERTFPYTDANMTVMPPIEAYKEAKQYRISGWKHITYDEIKPTLEKGLPVNVFMDFGGGHEVNVFGCDTGKWLIVNSWGTNWMDSGKQ